MTGPRESSLNDVSLAWTEAEAPDAAALREHIARDGFVIVRNVFSQKEIAQLRSIVRSHLKKAGSRYSLGRTQPNAALAVPELQYIFHHPKVVDLFKRLIDSERTVFTGHCDIHMNMLSGWHKDSGEAFGGYFTGDYMHDDECRVFKIAIYLQDAEERDGLTVRRGSHRLQEMDAGEMIQARTKAGDAVLFDVRLTHTGQLPDTVEKAIKALNLALKGPSRTTEDHRLATWLKAAYWKLIGRRDRLSVFFTFGLDNERTREFATANMMRQNSQAGIDEPRLPQELIDTFLHQGVRVSQY